MFKKIFNTLKRPEVFVPVTMAIMSSLILKMGKTQGALDLLNDLKKQAKEHEKLENCQNCCENEENKAENA